MVQLTIRDVPVEVKEALASAATSRGQSLQAYALGVLKREADFMTNADLIAEVDLDRAHLAGEDAPDAAEIIDLERKRRE
ncbi:hypothetical protein MU582_09305 [Nocardioidaceae bacterium SCSIO 66511]|nr:hypothetical protein MU582_09305 [Nocardioidaceae bacterium SCSIO 66511]